MSPELGAQERARDSSNISNCSIQVRADSPQLTGQEIIAGRPDLTDLAARVAAVAECRELFGKPAARRLWRVLDLPPPPRTSITPDRVPIALSDFIRDCLEPATEFISFRSISAAYLLWSQGKAATSASECALARALTAHGYAKFKSDGRMIYGARIKVPGPPPATSIEPKPRDQGVAPRSAVTVKRAARPSSPARSGRVSQRRR